MRDILIAALKLEIEGRLKSFLQEKGIELYMGANDNIAAGNPFIELETIDDTILNGSKLLFEIRVVLGVLGKSWQCDELIKGIYYTLHPHNVTLAELTVLLMSIHVEDLACDKPELRRKRAVMRYILEEC